MKFHYQEHNSGLRLFVAPREDTQAATILVLIGVGSNHEKPGQYGLAHFLEHMCFKGTKRRPKAMDIVSELDGLGAQYNAFTGHEKTGYYITIKKDHLARAVDIIADIYLNSTFPEQEIQKEKGVVTEEIKMMKDDPQSIVHEEYLATLYPGVSAGRPIAGTVESVQNFSRSDLRKFHRQYQGNNTVIVVAGAVEKQEVYKLIKNNFQDIPSQKPAKTPSNKVKQAEPKITTFYKKTEQTHIMLGFRSFGRNNEEVLALRILSSILGGNMSSRLFARLREEMGVAYYVGSYPEVNSNYGSLLLYAGVDKKRPAEVVAALLEEVKKIRDNLVWLGELDKAKEYILGNLALDLESSNSVAMFLGTQALFQENVLTPQAFDEKIRSISAEDIQTVARKVFKPENMVLSVVGPHKSDLQFAKVIDQFK